MLLQTMGKINLYTHKYKFHADEVVGCAMLLSVSPSTKIENITRIDYDERPSFGLRDFVLDVCRKYDAIRFFDHHQNEIKKDGTDKATAGLVYKFLVDNYYIEDFKDLRDLVKMVDDNDVGYVPAAFGTLPDIINKMNSYDINNDDLQFEAFAKAVNFVKDLIDNMLKVNKVNQERIKNTKKMLENTTPVNGVVYLTTYPTGWRDIILEQTIDADIIAWYNESKDQYCAQVIPKEKDSFEPKGRALCWDEEGVSNDEIVFVHKGNFYVAAKTKEALLEYIEKYAK